MRLERHRPAAGGPERQETTIVKKSSQRRRDEERAERRRQDRERLQQAARELLSSDGWARWVKTRAMFHSYSACNCALLAWQCHERGIVPTRIAGFHTWLKLGRCVRKGEVALRILAPVSVKERDRSTGAETDERRVFFKTAFVFDVSQTEIRDGAEPVALEPPHQPLTGESQAHLLAPLEAFAESLGYSVSFETIEGSAGGWCDPKRKRIVVDANVPANAQLRTLIHECAHALGIDYQRYSRAQAEVMAIKPPLIWRRRASAWISVASRFRMSPGGARTGRWRPSPRSRPGSTSSPAGSRLCSPPSRPDRARRREAVRRAAVHITTYGQQSPAPLVPEAWRVHAGRAGRQGEPGSQRSRIRVMSRRERRCKLRLRRDCDCDCAEPSNQRRSHA